MKRVVCMLAVITFFTVFAQDIEDIPVVELEQDTSIAVIDTIPETIPDFTTWIYIAADIKRMPVTTVHDILILQPGIVESEAGLHLRGGEVNDVGYYVDGIQTTIPIPLSAIDRLHVLPNPIDAEYSNALAGIVDITTKKRTDRLTGTFHYVNDNPFSDETLDRSYDRYEACLQGLLAPYASFTLAGNMTNTDVFQQALYKVPSPQEDYVLFGSVTLQVTKDRGYITFSGARSRDQYVIWTPYTEPGNRMKYLDQRPMSRTKRSLVAVSCDLQPFSKTDFSVNIGVNKNESIFGNRDYLWEDSIGTVWYDDYRLKAEHLIEYLRENEIPVREIVVDSIMQYHTLRENRGPEALRNIPYGTEGLFWGSGDYLEWAYRELNDKQIRLKLVQSIADWYDLKLGFDYTGFAVKKYANYLPPLDSPYWDFYERSPYIYGIYLHNRVQFGHMTADMGIRYDNFAPDACTYAAPTNNLDSTLIYAESRGSFSPHLGIIAILTPGMHTWLRYGHFIRQASFNQLYTGTDTLLIREILEQSGNPIGDIFAEPAQTHAIEYGIVYEHALGLSVSAVLYYRDIYNLPSIQYVMALPNSYYQYNNANAARVIGFEFNVLEPISDVWAFESDIIYQKATCDHVIYGPYFDILRNVPPDQDERLTIRNHIDFTSPADTRIPLLNDIITSLYVTFHSGHVYPLTDYRGYLIAYTDSIRMSGYWNVDIKTEKGFRIGPVKLVATALITNLLNLSQIVDVYNITGLPDEHGVPDPAMSQFGYMPITSDRYSPQADFDHDGLITPIEYYNDYIAARDDLYDDPTNWKNPFRFLLGVGIEF